MQSLDHPRQPFRREQLRLLPQRLLRLRIEIQPIQRTCSLINHDAAKVQRQFRKDLPQLFSLMQQLRHNNQCFLRRMPRDCLGHAEDPVMTDQSQKFLHLCKRDRVPGKRGALIQNGKRVAKTAIRMYRNEPKRCFLRLDAGLLRHIGKPRGNLIHRDALEIIALAARLDGGRHLVRLGRRKDEHHMGRRLLQGLQQRIERLGGEHVHLIDDIDLVSAVHGRKLHGLPQLADLIDAAVRGRINLKHVHG